MKFSATFSLSALIFFAAVVRAAERGNAERELIVPVFSFDAQQLAYVVAEMKEQESPDDSLEIQSTEIWTAQVDGSNAHRVTTGSIDGDVHWSPDGKQLAFVRRGDIWLVNADGSALQQITKTDKANETAAEFSNDGKLLFFVRREQITIDGPLKDNPDFMIDGAGAIFAYSLLTQTEQARFANQDDVQQIVPNRSDANEVFLLYRFYDVNFLTNAGKGAWTDTVLAAAKLDSGQRRVLQKWASDAPDTVNGIRAIASGVVVDTKKPDKDGEVFPELTVPGKNGDSALEFPLLFSDISQDGAFVTGIGVVYTGSGAERKLQRTVKIYDVAAKTTATLDKNRLLGLSMATEPTAEAKAHFDKGQAAWAQDGVGEALSEYDLAIELDPTYAAAYFQRGLCYVKRLESDEAIADFNAAIRLQPDNVEAYLQRAEQNLIVGDNAASLADCETAIRLAPNDAKTYRARALYYYATGDNEKAHADEQKALELEKK